MVPLSRVAVLCTLLVVVGSYPSGAPQSTCDDLTPRHGDLKPQVSQSPFLLSPALQRVSEGNKLQLVLNAPEGETFAGFMIQARAPDGSRGALGSFIADPDMAQTLTCGAGIRNTLTHSNNDRKKTLEIQWEPPAGYEGSVLFNSTFVKNGATFWVGVESEPVQVVRRSVGDPGPPTKGISTTKIPIRVTTVPNYTVRRPVQSAAAAMHRIYDGCKDKKLCFGYPEGCFDDGTCSAVVALTSSPSPPYLFTFELLGTNSKGYVAVGLSDDDKMGADSVVQCVNEKKLYVSVNDGKKNILVPNAPEINLKEISYDDGNIYCAYERPASTNIQGTSYDILNKQYYLLLAKGPMNEETAIGYHGSEERASSSSALTLTEVGIVGAKSNLLYRLHGAFMLLAWIGFAGSGMLVARYFKKTWVGTQACGKDIWFAWHRAFMVLTWLLTCAAFIIIFVEVGGWYGETSNPHGVLGVITTALCFFQPFGAALRPAPSSPRRPIFNWGHWLAGNLAHLLAIITIFFARQLAKAELPEWVDWIVAAYVAFHFVMHILFSLLDCCSQREQNQVNNFPMKEMGPNARMHNFADKRDAPQTGIRKFLLAIYLIIIIGLTVALVVISVLAPIEQNETVKMVVNYLKPNN